MLAMYLLVTLFTQLSPQNLWVMAEPGPSEIAVSFNKINGVKVGAPVLTEGDLVGSVSRIESTDDSYKVFLKITPGHRGLIRRGTIGLIVSPVSQLKQHAKNSPQTVIELFLPDSHTAASLVEGAELIGYSSYHDFWSADLLKQGLEQTMFQPKKS